MHAINVITNHWDDVCLDKTRSVLSNALN